VPGRHEHLDPPQLQRLFIRDELLELDNALFVDAEQLGGSPHRRALTALVPVDARGPNGVVDEDAPALPEDACINSGNAAMLATDICDISSMTAGG
jgi:hypothetical protein